MTPPRSTLASVEDALRRLTQPKRCPDCEQVKPPSDFTVITPTGRAPTLFTYCRACATARRRVNRRARATSCEICGAVRQRLGEVVFHGQPWRVCRRCPHWLRDYQWASPADLAQIIEDGERHMAEFQAQWERFVDLQSRTDRPLKSYQHLGHNHANCAEELTRLRRLGAKLQPAA